MSALLELDGVTAGYAGSPVLSDLSLDVEEGSVTALLGRNGMGKTTTLRTIMGILEAERGAVRFDGTDITGLKPNEVYSRGIGLVSEERDIFPDLTVVENLKVPVVESGETRWDVESLFELFPRIEERQMAKGEHLSGGEQQMLAIARVLRSEPRLLMLDEPTEGLAPQIQEGVAQNVAQIASEGATVLLVEQNVQKALEMADHAYIMELGEIVYEGDPEAILDGEEEVHRYLGVGQSAE